VSRISKAYGALILAQAAHSVEEYCGRLSAAAPLLLALATYLALQLRAEHQAPAAF
jgi:hypothetical protein